MGIKNDVYTFILVSEMFRHHGASLSKQPTADLHAQIGHGTQKDVSQT